VREGDDVGGRGVAEKFGVHAGDGGASDKRNFDLGRKGGAGSGQPLEGGVKPPPETLQRQADFSLPIVQMQERKFFHP
jgi:hypothetical protein